jgi:type I restriction enzyme R subunit
LFHFNIENAETFSQQISEIQDRTKVLAIKKALADARDLYNIIRLQGAYAFLQNLDFQKLNQLYRETSNHLYLLNLKESIESNADTANLLNIALEDVLFMFRKVREEELVLADQGPWGQLRSSRPQVHYSQGRAGKTVQEKEAERSYAGGDDFEH